MKEIISKEFREKNSNLTVKIDFSNDKNIYLNATKTALLFKKDLSNWRRSPQTLEYINVILSSVNSTELKKEDLIIVVVGKGKDQGTWIHKSLIIMFARWLSPEFAVWCDLQIEEILNSENSQSTQQTNDFNFAEETQANKEILEFIELITSQSPKNLFFLDKIYKSLNKNSPLELLQIDLNSYYFIPTELGKFLNKSAVEINKILEHKGFQFKENGEWFLTEKGKGFGFEFQNGSFKTIKWKLESLI